MPSEGRAPGVKCDTTLKDLLWRGAPALLRQLTGQTVVQPLQTEFPETRNRHPDFLARLADQSLFHLELQGDPERRMRWRMLGYYPLISEAFGGQPVRQMVLALTDAAARSMPCSIEHPLLTFRFEVRSAAQLDAEPLLASDHPDDHVLAILCRTDDITRRVRAILERLQHLTAKERSDAVMRLLVLAGLRQAALIVKREVEALNMLINIQQNEFLKEVFDKGALQGKTEGKVDLLLRLLEQRFGEPVAEPYRERLTNATEQQLDRWSLAILTADSLESVFDGKPH